MPHTRYVLNKVRRDRRPRDVPLYCRRRPALWKGHVGYDTHIYRCGGIKARQARRFPILLTSTGENGLRGRPGLPRIKIDIPATPMCLSYCPIDQGADARSLHTQKKTRKEAFTLTNYTRRRAILRSRLHVGGARRIPTGPFFSLAGLWLRLLRGGLRRDRPGGT